MATFYVVYDKKDREIRGFPPGMGIKEAKLICDDPVSDEEVADVITKLIKLLMEHTTYA